MKKILKHLSIVGLFLLVAGNVWAVNIEFVPVGDAGNSADERTGHGRVDYGYQIAKYDVTAGQYCEFLNAVAAVSDPYGLYNAKMEVKGTEIWGCNIIRTGAAGSYQYTVAADWANRPVNYVSWGDSARFCNWLQTGTTENGAYTLDGAMTNEALMAVTRNANTQYCLPTLDEWYKAAYYDVNKPGGAGYWLFPTRSDDFPSNQLSATGTNNANFFDFSGKEPSLLTIGAPYFRTEVGAFASSPGPYGTFDQGGNVIQWNETAVDSIDRGALGTDFDGAAVAMSVYRWGGGIPTDEGSYAGFRVASLTVPEPSSLVMTLVVLFGVALLLGASIPKQFKIP
jgi:formylglycine-generating enzyme required for sulfatase activity